MDETSALQPRTPLRQLKCCNSFQTGTFPNLAKLYIKSQKKFKGGEGGGGGRGRSCRKIVQCVLRSDLLYSGGGGGGEGGG